MQRLSTIPHTSRAHALGIVLMMTALVACSDSPETTSTVQVPINPGISIGEQIVAGLSVSSHTVLPGDSVQVAVHVPSQTKPEVTIQGNGQSPTGLKFAATDSGWIGQAAVQAPSTLGDWLLQAVGHAGTTPIKGFAQVNVVPTQSCGGSLTPEAGQCVVSGTGHRLQKTGSSLVNAGPDDPDVPDARLMIHPRMIQRYENVIVGCHTDSVGMIPIEAMQSDHAPPIRSQDDRPVVETMLTEGGLVACENLLLLPEKSLAVTGSRGDSGNSGGIATWKIPDTTAEPLPPMQHRDTLLDTNGVEGLATDGDRVYAMAKPNRVLVLQIDDDGTITLENEVTISELVSAWQVAIDGDRLYVTDAAHSDDFHVHTDGDHAGGHLLVLDRSQPAAPSFLGIANTTGSAKGLAVLPDQQVAVASGAGGVDLFDVSQPLGPIRLSTIDTPHSAQDVAFDSGYLVVADWETVRLYDASQRGQLRLLDAADMHTSSSPTGPSNGAGYGGIVAASHVTVSKGEMLVAEFDHVFMGSILNGLDAPRLTLLDRRRVVSPPKDGAPVNFAVRIRNDGRQTLWVTPEQTAFVNSPDSALILGPGETGSIDIKLLGLDTPDAPTVVHFTSNDPAATTRAFEVVHINQTYQIGDIAPEFELPIVDSCAGGTCEAAESCFRLNEALGQGKPIFFAFYSTW